MTVSHMIWAKPRKTLTIVLMTMMPTYALNVFIHGPQHSTTMSVFSSFGLGFLLGCLVIGYVMDGYNHIKTLQYSTLAFILLSCLGCFHLPNNGLIAADTLLGAVSSTGWIMARVLIFHHSDNIELTGSQFSLLLAYSGLFGTFLAPHLGWLLQQWFGHHAIALMVGIYGIVLYWLSRDRLAVSHKPLNHMTQPLPSITTALKILTKNPTYLCALSTYVLVFIRSSLLNSVTPIIINTYHLHTNLLPWLTALNILTSVIFLSINAVCIHKLSIKLHDLMHYASMIVLALYTLAMIYCYFLKTSAVVLILIFQLGIACTAFILPNLFTLAVTQHHTQLGFVIALSAVTAYICSALYTIANHWIGLDHHLNDIVLIQVMISLIALAIVKYYHHVVREH